MSTVRTSLLLPMALLVAACGSGQLGKPKRAAQTSRPVQAPPATSTAVSAPTSPQPPEALVTDETQNRLLAVDLPSGQIAWSVHLPADPEDIAAAGNDGMVIVVSSRAGEAAILRRSPLRPIKILGGFANPHIVAISPDYRYAYITDDARGTVTAIRLRDLKVTSTVTVGPAAHHLAFSPDQRQVWVALGESARMITLLTTVVRTPPPSGPIIDPGHPRVIGHFAPGFPAHDLAFSPDGRGVWITSAAGPDATVFDARDHDVLFRVPVGAPPQHLAFFGRYAYLTSGYGSTIEKVDAATGHVITRATSPYGSFELAAADGYVATVSLLRGTLAIYTPNLKLLRVVKLAPATREVAISQP
jgi:hypothetical protein